MDALPFNEQDDLIIKDPKVFRYLFLSLPVSQKIVENVMFSILYKYQGNLFMLYHMMREIRLIFGLKEPLSYMDLLVAVPGNGQLNLETEDSVSRMSDYDQPKAKPSKFVVTRYDENHQRLSKQMANTRTEESTDQNEDDRFVEYVQTYVARDLKANILKIKQICFSYFKRILWIFEEVVANV